MEIGYQVILGRVERDPTTGVLSADFSTPMSLIMSDLFQDNTAGMKSITYADVAETTILKYVDKVVNISNLVESFTYHDELNTPISVLSMKVVAGRSTILDEFFRPMRIFQVSKMYGDTMEIICTCVSNGFKYNTDPDRIGYEIECLDIMSVMSFPNLTSQEGYSIQPDRFEYGTTNTPQKLKYVGLTEDGQAYVYRLVIPGDTDPIDQWAPYPTPEISVTTIVNTNTVHLSLNKLTDVVQILCSKGEVRIDVGWAQLNEYSSGIPLGYTPLDPPEVVEPLNISGVVNVYAHMAQYNLDNSEITVIPNSFSGFSITYNDTGNMRLLWESLTSVPQGIPQTSFFYNMRTGIRFRSESVTHEIDPIDHGYIYYTAATLPYLPSAGDVLYCNRDNSYPQVLGDLLVKSGITPGEGSFQFSPMPDPIIGGVTTHVVSPPMAFEFQEKTTPLDVYKYLREKYMLFPAYHMRADKLGNIKTTTVLQVKSPTTPITIDNSVAGGGDRTDINLFTDVYIKAPASPHSVLSLPINTAGKSTCVLNRTEIEHIFDTTPAYNTLWTYILPDTDTPNDWTDLSVRDVNGNYLVVKVPQADITCLTNESRPHKLPIYNWQNMPRDSSYAVGLESVVYCGKFGLENVLILFQTSNVDDSRAEQCYVDFQTLLSNLRGVELLRWTDLTAPIEEITIDMTNHFFSRTDVYQDRMENANSAGIFLLGRRTIEPTLQRLRIDYLDVFGNWVPMAKITATTAKPIDRVTLTAKDFIGRVPVQTDAIRLMCEEPFSASTIGRIKDGDPMINVPSFVTAVFLHSFIVRSGGYLIGKAVLGETMPYSSTDTDPTHYPNNVDNVWSRLRSSYIPREHCIEDGPEWADTQEKVDSLALEWLRQDIQNLNPVTVHAIPTTNISVGDTVYLDHWKTNCTFLVTEITKDSSGMEQFTVIDTIGDSYGH